MAEQSYDTTNWDCMTVIWADLLLFEYLEGRNSAILTGHNALKCIFSQTEAPGKLVGWRPPASEFEFYVVKNAGIKSRLLTRCHDSIQL